jgi:hypothetical protein
LPSTSHAHSESVEDRSSRSVGSRTRAGATLVEDLDLGGGDMERQDVHVGGLTGARRSIGPTPLPFGRPAGE